MNSKIGRKSRRQIQQTKIYVLDTNVLIHDPNAVDAFEDNEVVVFAETIVELDRFKTEGGERGAAARAASKNLLAALEEAGGPACLQVRSVDQLPQDNKSERSVSKSMGSLAYADRRIILGTVRLMQSNPTRRVVLVTKDHNMRILGIAVGIDCQDYIHDKVDGSVVEDEEEKIIELSVPEYQAFSSLRPPQPGVGGRECATLNTTLGRGILPNDYVLFSPAGDPGRVMPARCIEDGRFARVRGFDQNSPLRVPRSPRCLSPKNFGQHFLLDALTDPNIRMVTISGPAGTGKTLLACATALAQIEEGRYRRLIISRPITRDRDNDLGFMPGDKDEKMMSWVAPVYDAFAALYPQGITDNNGGGQGKQGREQGRGHTVSNVLAQPKKASPKVPDILKAAGLLEIEGLQYLRGRNLEGAVVFVDEMQNATAGMAKTIVTRAARNTKVVLAGDPDQIDHPFLDKHANGLVHVASRLRGQLGCAHITLTRTERSELAELGAKLL